MDYKQSKKLLFDEEVKLTTKQAEEILLLWNDDPNAFFKILNCDKEKLTLKKYHGINEKTFVHEFVDSDVCVFGNNIAKKFFELMDDEISVNFINTLTLNTFKKLKVMNVFMWPYFDKLSDFVSFAMLKTLISSKFFCFDFADDVSGARFEKIMSCTKGEDFYQDLLAVNSFNITDVLVSSRARNLLPIMDLARLHAFSSHHFEGFEEDYAGFRKLFISYLDFAVEAQEFTLEQIKKQQGVVMN